MTISLSVKTPLCAAIPPRGEGRRWGLPDACSCHQVPAPREAGSGAEGSPVPASLPEKTKPAPSGFLQWTPAGPRNTTSTLLAGMWTRRLPFQENTIISQRL
ncbi:PREDICTED: uncharacterized protein LOC105516539 [Colobus angolensis palliatus]|uniref:uncharacterized protein LOC105516539 n=1 Tax=Colobus angolensis palliatus TaxID=336983 RepID=UPI0005F55127|nr:PREDICTED: uncharacterized protein LOC105516539 [Colobus angolensis palliatus]